jgi:lipoyl-dependent peroxiredoxin subunit D
VGEGHAGAHNPPPPPKGRVMSIESLKNALPDYAKDLKLNLSSLAAEPTLSEQQRAGTFIASALAARSPVVIDAMMDAFAAKLEPAALDAAKAAASIMAMNNIYYRFVHLVSAADYKTLPAKLRMNVIGKPGVEKVDFELWSLAVSAINGCGMCVDAHERELRKAGLGADAVQAAVRIAAVVHAVAATLDGEAARPRLATAAA